MGLVPTPEHDWAHDSIRAIGEVARRYLDLKAITAVARRADRLPAVSQIAPDQDIKEAANQSPRVKPKIGIIRDSAFQFYYPENIEALTRAGAEVIFCSPLTADMLPPVDGLYIGGGFPETHAAALANNHVFRRQLKKTGRRRSADLCRVRRADVSGRTAGAGRNGLSHGRGSAGCLRIFQKTPGTRIYDRHG